MDVNYDEIAKTIAEAVEDVGTKDNILTLNMKQSDYIGLMKDQGVTEATVRQVAAAQAAIDNGCIITAKDRLLADDSLSRVVIKQRTPSGINEIRYTRELETRSPKDGTKSMKYGVVSVTVRRKSKLDKDLIARCAEEVENKK